MWRRISNWRTPNTCPHSLLPGMDFWQIICSTGGICKITGAGHKAERQIASHLKYPSQAPDVPKQGIQEWYSKQDELLCTPHPHCLWLGNSLTQPITLPWETGQPNPTAYYIQWVPDSSFPLCLTGTDPNLECWDSWSNKGYKHTRWRQVIGHSRSQRRLLASCKINTQKIYLKLK